MLQTLCRDRVLEVLHSVSMPLSTRQVANRLPDESKHNVSQNLRQLWLEQEVVRTGYGHHSFVWQTRPLEIVAYEDDTGEDRRFCRNLDRAMALAKRDREERDGSR